MSLSRRLQHLGQASRRMLRRQLKSRLAIPRRSQTLRNNRPHTRSPFSHNSRRKDSRQIRRTLASRLNPAARVPEARAPGTLLQKHPEAAAPLVDRRQLPMHVRLRRDPRREPLHLEPPVSRGRAHGIRLEKVFLAVKRKNYAQRQAVLCV